MDQAVRAAGDAMAQQRAREGNDSSQFRGVSWNSKRGIWCATMRISNKQTQLGAFKNEEEAARCWDEAQRKHKGGRAALNFPREGETSTSKSSQYRGVCFSKITQRWKVEIRYGPDRCRYALGSYDDEALAARVYDHLARI
jgi:hypothetical protein